ncbi:hypothetical protein [Cytobacillus sp. IB215665]|uniref:hypothetical protein n=1 Tax=Cytobacillus sp. IB215665 TaxID=3097357 RepID=UPI002A153CAD|nr:hypothetical protein [Cytobacillus sp. IB215665]MDX8365581.1 hypothetical protein [Cytobacillus sp. IB215665]
MKKSIYVLLFCIFIFMIGGCEADNKTANNFEPEMNVLYFGEGKKWFATFSVAKVRNSYFESMYIQYIQDRNPHEYQLPTEIEYVLNTGVSSFKSNSPVL